MTGSGLFGHRVNVTPHVGLGPCTPAMYDEVLSDANGNYLGAFDQLYVVPFGLEYPLGWTHGGWVETEGLALVEATNCCGDCEGSGAIDYWGRFRQRFPDELINCKTAGIFDQFDYAIMPDRYLGFDGCRYVFNPTAACGGVAFPPPGKCQINIALEFWKHEPFPWPLVGFAFQNPASRIRVVTDTSGPVGCEDALALEVDFSGAGNEGVTFVGEDGGYDGSVPTQGLPNDTRATTNWTVEDGSCWIESFWIKAVPDNEGFVCEGYDIITKAGLYPWPFARILVGGDPGPLVLTDEWQYWDYVWQAHYTSTPNPLLHAMWGIQTTQVNAYVPTAADEAWEAMSGIPCGSRPQFSRKGRVHIKQPHLSPCEISDGVIVKRPSSMGT